MIDFPSYRPSDFAPPPPLIPAPLRRVGLAALLSAITIATVAAGYRWSEKPGAFVTTDNAYGEVRPRCLSHLRLQGFGPTRGPMLHGVFRTIAPINMQEIATTPQFVHQPSQKIGRMKPCKPENNWWWP
jgi:hypothetical protein